MALAQQDSQIEEIVVTGIRSSLQQSLDRKRNATNIVDAITAEDIGAFPDQNLAESLQRISGVAIDRKLGEGSLISIRGLGPDFVQVTTNGRVASSNINIQSSGDAHRASNNGSRIVGFDQFQSGLVQAVEVYKSPQANHVEGGLGGIVEIQTRRPLDLGQRHINLRAQGMYSELADSTGPSLFGLFSDTFADNTIGFMISAQWDDRTIRTDEIDNTSWSGQPSQWDLDRDGTVDVQGFNMENTRAHYIEQDRERLNISSALQWRPNDRVDATLDLLYTELATNDWMLQIPLRTSAQITSNIVDAVAEDDNGTSVISKFTTAGARPRPFPRIIDNTSEGLTIGGNVQFQFNERLSFNFDLSRSESETNGQVDYGFWEVNGPATVSYDETGIYSDKPSVTTTYDLNDPTLFHQVLIGFARNEMTDEELQFRADATYEFYDSWIDSVQVGVRYSDRERNDRGRNFRTTVFRGEPLTDVGTVPFPASDFLSGISTNFPKSWVIPDLAKGMRDLIVGRADEIPTGSGNLESTIQSSDIRYTEEVTALYAMANFSGELGTTPYSGNVGVRYVDTDTRATGLVQDVIGFQQVTQTTAILIFSEPFARDVGNSYTEVLPSVNLRFELRDDLLLRLAGGKVMGRPTFKELNPGAGGSAVLRLITSGNPELDPITAWQADLALEWYFSDYAIASVGVFGKWAEGFVQVDQTLRTLPDQIDPDTDRPLVLRVQQPLNGTDSSLTGIELNYQQTFPGLPAPFDGLGAIFNYTRINSDSNFENSEGGSLGIPGLSENTINASLFYEKGPYTARLSYNKRDEFVDWLADSRGHPLYVQDFKSVDALLRYRWNEQVTFSLEGINLTDENVRMYNTVGAGKRKWFNSELNTGRRLQAGVQMQF
jgi:TonB-dependent receptor